jgi:hypothetical protein
LPCFQYRSAESALNERRANRIPKKGFMLFSLIWIQLFARLSGIG